MAWWSFENKLSRVWWLGVSILAPFPFFSDPSLQTCETWSSCSSSLAWLPVWCTSRWAASARPSPEDQYLSRILTWVPSLVRNGWICVNNAGFVRHFFQNYGNFGNRNRQTMRGGRGRNRLGRRFRKGRSRPRGRGTNAFVGNNNRIRNIGRGAIIGWFLHT